MEMFKIGDEVVVIGAFDGLEIGDLYSVRGVLYAYPFRVGDKPTGLILSNGVQVPVEGVVVKSSLYVVDNLGYWREVQPGLGTVVQSEYTGVMLRVGNDYYFFECGPFYAYQWEDESNGGAVVVNRQRFTDLEDAVKDALALGLESGFPPSADEVAR